MLAAKSPPPNMTASWASERDSLMSSVSTSQMARRLSRSIAVSHCVINRIGGAFRCTSDLLFSLSTLSNTCVQKNTDQPALNPIQTAHDSQKNEISAKKIASGAQIVKELGLKMVCASGIFEHVVVSGAVYAD